MKGKWILYIFMLLVLVLTACGGESSDTDDGVVTIKFNHWYNEQAGNWEEVIAAFEEEHPHIKVESEPLVNNLSHADYLQQLDLRASAGETLDVVMFSNPYDFATRVDSGLLAPLDPFIEDEGIEITEEYNGLFSQGKIDGSYYGLPGKKNTYLIVLNKNHLDEAGLEVPTDWTWDEYEEYAKELTTGEGNNKRYGSYFHTFNDFYFMLKLLSQPSDNFILKEDGSSNMDDPMIKASLKLRYDMEEVDSSSVPYSNTISQGLDYRQQFFSESTSMIPMTSIMITEWGEYVPEFTMAFAPWPKNEEGDDFKSYNAGDVIGIAENSQHKDEAYEFIRWMSTEGMLVQQRSIPAWSQANLDEVVDNLIEISPKPEAIDAESIKYVMDVSEDTEQFIPKPYIRKAYEAYQEEVELYLLGDQDLDTTIENAKVKVQEVIDSNLD